MIATIKDTERKVDYMELTVNLKKEINKETRRRNKFVL